MRRWRWSLLVPGLIAVAVILIVFGFNWQRSSRDVSAQSTFQLSIDADPTNGTRPCDPVDPMRAVDPGDTYTVGLCIENQPEAPQSFLIRVVYDGDLNTAPEVADVSPALDDNPDANDGDGGVAGDKLGIMWDCSGFGVAFPKGDDPLTPESDARIVCNANIIVPDADLTISPGLLATITFEASPTNLGAEALVYSADTAIGGAAGGIGKCGGVEPIIPCIGATIFKGVTPTPSPSVSPTPTFTPTVTLTPTITPTPTTTPTPTITLTPTASPEVTPTRTPTPPPSPDDLDSDGILNLDDNCPTVFNVDQTNTPIGPIDNGPGVPGDDTTLPNEDNLGDICDNDKDNDGLHDLRELVGCGSGPTDPGWPTLDDTYDDDGDGNPGPPMGTDTDGSDDGPSWDSDADGALDGLECFFGSDPNHAVFTPSVAACGGTGDGDGDGLVDASELCGWGTNAALVETDGDGLSDCAEVADVDGNGVADFLNDTLPVLKAALLASPPTKSGAMDADKDGVISFDDALLVAKIALKGGFCPPPPLPIPDDLDRDGVLDDVDNCARVFNPLQINTPMGPIDNGPGLPGDDGTVPHGDRLGNHCDPDADNDGLPDLLEAFPDGTGHYACAIMGGPNVPTDPGVPVLDNSWDDNGDGNPAPPLGTDVMDDGPSWDTDGDSVVDGAECTRGYDPTSASSRPTVGECGGLGDGDGDGLPDAWETCGWGTNADLVDTDDDGLGDCVEAVDVTGDGHLDFLGDLLGTARAVLRPPSSFGRNGDFDLDKNMALDFVGDVLESGRFVFGSKVCQ